eukprot:6130490-Lingulodinium_polyedra.AAC.1
MEIKGQWSFNNNWSEKKAELKKGSSKIDLWESFGEHGLHEKMMQLKDGHAKVIPEAEVPALVSVNTSAGAQ